MITSYTRSCDFSSFSKFLFIGILFFFQAEDDIRDGHVTGVQTCALQIFRVIDKTYEYRKKAIQKDRLSKSNNALRADGYYSASCFQQSLPPLRRCKVKIKKNDEISK